jgi:hypothetical protein
MKCDSPRSDVAVFAVFAICLIAGFCAYARFGYSAGNSSTPKPDYANAGLAFEADAAAVKVAVGETITHKAAEFAESLTATAVYDRTGNVRSALANGAKAGKFVGTVVKVFALKDLAEYAYLAGGVVADFKVNGFSKGLMAAYDRLNQSDLARPFVKMGEFAGRALAEGVHNVQKAIERNRRIVQSPSKEVAANKDSVFHPPAALDSGDRINHSVKNVDEKVLISKAPNIEATYSDSTKTSDSQVGVRGWCGCGDNHGKLYDVVDPFILMMCADKKDKSPEANKMLANLRYSYILCAKCGKCRRPSARSNAASWDQVNWRHELVICDNILELQLFRAKGLTSTQKMRLKLAPQEEFLKKIPDGGILFPGACACKVPDPVHVGPLFSDYEQYVCLICGHVRLPDATGNIPGGPTSLSSMGFDEQADAARKRLYQWLKNL